MTNFISSFFGLAALVFIGWIGLGISGVADGCDDDCTKAFVAVCKLAGVTK